MSSNLMDTEPGGETTQYQSIQTVTKPPAKESGQMNKQAQVDSPKLSQSEKERGERTAENIRYGQSISENGFGGQTTGNSGSTVQDGYGSAKVPESDDAIDQTRRMQGYGDGSGVGA